MAKKARGYTVNGVRKALAVNVGGVMKIAAHDDCCCEENIIPDCEYCCPDDSYGPQGKCPKYMSVSLIDYAWAWMDGTYICEYNISSGDYWYHNCGCDEGARVGQLRFILGWDADPGTCNVTLSYQDCYCSPPGGSNLLRQSCPFGSPASNGCDGDSMIICGTAHDGATVSWFPCDEFGNPL
jgi:hypothetical protein